MASNWNDLWTALKNYIDSKVTSGGVDGAQGPKGDKGDKGDPGPQGLKGDPGAPGSTWLSGTVLSGNGGNNQGISTQITDSKVGDYYFNPSTGDIYRQTTLNFWSYQGNIKGPKGDKGDPGISDEITALEINSWYESL